MAKKYKLWISLFLVTPATVHPTHSCSIIRAVGIISLKQYFHQILQQWLLSEEIWTPKYNAKRPSLTTSLLHFPTFSFDFVFCILILCFVCFVCFVMFYKKIPPSYLRYFFIILSLFLCREIEILLLSLSPVGWLHKKELLYNYFIIIYKNYCNT